MPNQIYVYLARRDKKGIKVISSFSSKHLCYPTKINIKDLSKTLISSSIQEQIIRDFNKNNLLYEIYIESASSAEEFRKSLISRGYENIPVHQISISLGYNQIDDKLLITKNSTMIRKNSDQPRRT
jgi:tRNA A37 threonylcarbamoyladenosine dehydratase